MALTPVFCTGFEHGVSPAAANGGGLGGAITGAPTVRTGFARSGAYSCRLNPAGAGLNLQMPPGAAMSGIRRASQRLYLRFTTKPTANANLLTFAGPASSGTFRYTSASDRFSIFVGASTVVDIADAGSPTTGVYYLVELFFDASGTTFSVSCRVNGGTVYSTTLTGQTAADITRFNVGTGTTHTYDMDVDDWIGGSASTAGPEWWGAGHAVLLKPNADGSGSGNPGVNVMELPAGGDIGSGGRVGWDQLVDIPISEATTYVRQAAAGTSNYVEVTFEDTTAATINAVEAVLAYAASGATANSGETRIRRGDGTPTDVLGLGAAGSGLTTVQRSNVGTAWDMSGTAVKYKANLVPLSVDGTDYAGWTPTLLNALLARVGYSGNVATVPRWGNLVLEADVSDNVSITTTAIALAASILTPTVTASGDASATPSSVARTASVPTPSLSADAGATPSAVARTAAMAAPTVTAGASATPAALVRAAAIPAPTVTAGADATPASIARAASIPTPAVGTASGATITPATVARAVAIPAPLKAADANLVLTTIARAVSIGVSIGSVTSPAPATLARAAVIATPSVEANANVLLSTLALVASIGTVHAGMFNDLGGAGADGFIDMWDGALSSTLGRASGMGVSSTSGTIDAPERRVVDLKGRT